MGDLVNYSVEVLVNIFDMYIIYRYMTIFFGDKFAHKKLAVVMYAVRFVLLFVFGTIELSPLVSFVMYLAVLFVITLCYASTLLKKCIVIMLIFMCGFVGEIIVALCVGLSNFDLYGQSKQIDSFYKVIMELFFWATTLVVQRFKNVNSNAPISKSFVVAIAVIPISSIYLEYMIFQQKNVDSSMAGLSLMCVLATNFILIYLYDSLSKMFQERTRAAIVEREKEYYHEQAKVLKIQYEELKHFRHDFTNRMVVIEEMIHKRKYDRVLEYTRLISKKLNQTNVYSATGNLMIDSVINYKLSRAVEQGVSVRADVILPEQVSFDEDDVVVILGNLLDNAIEATQRLADNKFIYIDVKFDKGTLLIHIENSYDSIIYRDMDRFVTRKSDGNLHGIGLQSVDTIVEKYDGELDIENDKSTFVVDVLLYV